MNRTNLALSTWQQRSSKPAGKWAFSRIVCRKAPYFNSIRPAFVELRPGYCEVRVKKRRRVLNHIGTVHAIAMCNMAELAGGTIMEVTVPSGYRWIPKGMTVQYVRRAETDLKAVAQISPIPQFDVTLELLVTVIVLDADDQAVFRAVITMWVSPKKSKSSSYLVIADVESPHLEAHHGGCWPFGFASVKRVVANSSAMRLNFSKSANIQLPLEWA